jgi:hypothetical protein
MVARYMSPVTQGYYYTLSSLLALQSFLELGCYLAVLNFASHEWARLWLGPDRQILGDSDALSRLVSLGRSASRWYGIAVAIFVPTISVVGLVFFSRSATTDVSWRAPWLTLVLLTGMLVWLLPLHSLLEGCNQVAEINKARLAQTIVGSLAQWSALALGAGLWAAVVWAAICVLRDLYMLLIRYRKFFRVFLKHPRGPLIGWRDEVWPLQWRLGLTGIVSYFSFWLFTPVMFRYHGPVTAGQMGMTLALVVAVQSLAMMWITPSVARFGVLIAQGDWEALDRFWSRRAAASVAVAVMTAFVAWGVVFYLSEARPSLASRALPPGPTALFLAAGVLGQVIQCLIAYLRAHKREPLLSMNIFAGILTGLLVWGLGRRFGPTGAGIAYLVVVGGIMLPWSFFVWLNFRRQSHSRSLSA